MSAVFEGSEKKLEIIFNSATGSIRELPETFWMEVIKAAGAKVLSKIENQDITAYLLSESSLFIWNECLVLITCGTTTLIQAAQKIIDHFGPDKIEAFFFERKNEYFPHRQKTDFYEDMHVLDKKLSTKAFRLGRADEHHLFLSYLVKKSDPVRLDRTLEVLMYDLQGPARKIFSNAKSTAAEIRQQSGIDKIFSGFKIDDFSFDPTGYSLNAINGSKYFTIHVTPQECSPYVSFETNVSQDALDIDRALNSVLEVFRPSNFDIVYFDDKGFDDQIKVPGYAKRSHIKHKLSDEFFVQFSHFGQDVLRVEKAVPIKSSWGLS